MIPKGCKRLAEVDFPIAVVSKHAAREKSIRHGHPSTLHLWWARRPLASSRAVLLALLWPDPCDPLCPAAFKVEARKRLQEVAIHPGETDVDLRRALLRFIGDFADWDNAAHPAYLDVSRALVSAANAPAGDAPYEPPLIVDPFAGGGSIPLEALRVGCDAFASDLNQVAAFILKVMLEDLPRSSPEFVDQVESAGQRAREVARRRLADLYPGDESGATPLGYIWARSVRCESADCGAEIPVYRTAWLSRRGATRARYFREAKDGQCVAVLVESAPLGGPVAFRIATGHGSEAPRDGWLRVEGTKAPGGSANVYCPCCKRVLSGNKQNPRVPLQLAAQHGCMDVVFDAQGNRIGGAYLLAVALLGGEQRTRHFRLASPADYRAVHRAQELLREIGVSRIDQSSRVPDERINSVRPSPNARGLSAVTRYGLESFGALFTVRQKVALIALQDAIWEVTNDLRTQEFLALALSRFVDICNGLCRWESTKTQIRNLFARQAIAFMWDFAEPAVFAEQAGDFGVTLDTMLRVLRGLPRSTSTAQVQLADAAESPLPDGAAAVWFTDPPYYDAIPYADLSDFFFVWLRRTLPDHPMFRDPFDAINRLTHKERECVWNRGHTYQGKVKDGAFFEKRVKNCFEEGRRVLNEDGIGAVVFAHQTTEGWETLIGGLIGAGWTVTSSWPIATELASRVRARDNASLTTSVHLVCRPRPPDAGTGDWAYVLRELPRRVGAWMERLQAEGVRGADLVFACIGPALEIFSCYERVEAADGREVQLGEYLEEVWKVVGQSALAQVLGTAEAKARNGAAGAIEEDARLTALFLWTLQSTDTDSGADGDTGEEEESGDDAGDEDDDESDAPKSKPKGFTLVYDVVRRFAQPLGINLPAWEGRVIETKKGTVRLLPIAERARQLFGEEGAQAVAARLEHHATLGPNDLQGMLFPELEVAPPVRGAADRRRTRSGAADISDAAMETRREATTLDRVHAAMLFQAAGRTHGLRALLRAEQERGPDFLRLANALSALYPRGSEEKRLLDAMLLAVPR